MKRNNGEKGGNLVSSSLGAKLQACRRKEEHNWRKRVADRFTTRIRQGEERKRKRREVRRGQWVPRSGAPQTRYGEEKEEKEWRTEGRGRRRK